MERDYPRRVDFCLWYYQKAIRYPLFQSLILWGDESHFNQTGIFNYQNHHLWKPANPKATVTRSKQRRFSINVWCGIVGDHLIGPHVLPNKLTGEHYLQFLQEHLPVLLEDVPINIRRIMWFQHDGAPAHASRAVCEYLDACFPNKWLGRNGPIAWPARSPDLNPIDWFLWGRIKSLVYATNVESRDQLLPRIQAACDEIRRDPEVFGRIRTNMLRRARLCIHRRGEHFENHLPKGDRRRLEQHPP